MPVVHDVGLLFLDFSGEFMLSVNKEIKETTGSPYFLLHPFVTRKVEMTMGKKHDGMPSQLPVMTLDDLDACVTGFRLRDIG